MEVYPRRLAFAGRAVYVSGKWSKDRKMHRRSLFNGVPSNRSASLLNHLAARGPSFAMEIEIVSVCKPHWNVLLGNGGRALRARLVRFSSCAPHVSTSRHGRCIRRVSRHVTDHRKTCIHGRTLVVRPPPVCITLEIEKSFRRWLRCALNELRGALIAWCVCTGNDRNEILLGLSYQW